MCLILWFLPVRQIIILSVKAVQSVTWEETAKEFLAALPEKSRSWVAEKVDLHAPLLQDLHHKKAAYKIGYDPEQHRFSAARLLRTLVWQSHARILCGEIQPVNSNIRSFYYHYSQPLFTELDLFQELQETPGYKQVVESIPEVTPDNPRYEKFCEWLRQAGIDLKTTNPMQLLHNAVITRNYLSDLTEEAIAAFIKQRIFKYTKPWEFTDHNEHFHKLGLAHSGLVFATEKTGLWSIYAERYANQYGISAIASQGNPSWLSIEILSDEIKARGTTNVRIGVLCDYDPGGFTIAQDFKKKFEVLGLKVQKLTILTTLAMFSERDLASNADDLTSLGRGQKTRADRWFQKTNGINGRKAGIHVDQAIPHCVDQVVRKWVRLNSRDQA